MFPQRTVAFFVAVILLTSCRLVSLVPPYSAELEQQVAAAAKATDRLYIDIIDTAPAGRSYATFKDRYNDIMAEINSIQLKNEARPKNADLLLIIKNLKEAFAEAKDYHKGQDNLTNGEAKAYQFTLTAFWRPLYIAEKALKE